MANSPQRNLPLFNEQEFTTQKKAQLRILHPEKSEAQIRSMAKKSLKKEVRRLLSTNQPSTNQRNLDATDRILQSNFSDPNDPARRLVFGGESPAGGQSSTGSSGRGRIQGDSQISRRSLHEEYNNFCRYYRQKLRRQHPRWTGQQISIIIKLMWRKKAISSKKLSTHFMGRISRRNPLTGRKYFGDMKRKEENMEADEIRLRWYGLTQETRKYLARLGKGGDGFSYPLTIMPKTIRYDLRREFEPVSLMDNGLSFLNGIISQN